MHMRGGCGTESLGIFTGFDFRPSVAKFRVVVSRSVRIVLI